MNFVLLDWTRMGKTYCLAGVVWQAGQWRIVRPLWARNKGAPVRNVGWSPFMLDGHRRWEVFQLVGPQPATPEAPHLEDVWVRELKPLRQDAPPDVRCAILEATRTPSEQPLFGASLTFTRAAAYLVPGEGGRSLASVAVPLEKVSFAYSFRDGAECADHRVQLDLPGLSGRMIPVKDHFLLRQAEQSSAEPEAQSRHLASLVSKMGPEVVVRLGLSRAHQGYCWLMADGFFSSSDPQP